MERLPVIRKPRVRLHSTDFSDLRTDEEVARFLRAAQPEGPMVYMLYLTPLSTGTRAGDLAGLHWSDVNFPSRLITVVRSFEEPTKAEDVRYVPILDSLLPDPSALAARAPRQARVHEPRRPYAGQERSRL
jgi:integrase